MDARDFFGYKHADEEPGRNPEDYEGDERDPEALPQLDEAITLDDPAVLARIDPDDMLGRVRELPRQMAQARRVAAAVELPARFGEVDAVVVLAMGGSAIGAELVVGIAGDRLRVPLIVHRDYDLPSWVGKRTLVIAASHSGETAETLAAVAAARRLGAPLAVITTGGRLGQSASVAGEPLFLYRAPGQPRAAVGFGTGLVHELLARAGLLSDPDPFGPAVEALESILERMGPAIDTDANPAKQLAWQLFGRIAVIYGGGLMAPVAHRWKTQINENAKAWASWEPMPEANHNAIEGSFNPRDLADAAGGRRGARSRRAAGDRRALSGRRRAARASAPRIAAPCGPRARHRWPASMTALAFGDLVSVYLAILYQTDPTPVTLLSMLKERLARATSSDEAPGQIGAGRAGAREGSARAFEHDRQGREGDALRARARPRQAPAIRSELRGRQQQPHRHPRPRSLALRLPPVRIRRRMRRTPSRCRRCSIRCSPTSPGDAPLRHTRGGRHARLTAAGHCRLLGSSPPTEDPRRVPPPKGRRSNGEAGVMPALSRNCVRAGSAMRRPVREPGRPAMSRCHDPRVKGNGIIHGTRRNAPPPPSPHRRRAAGCLPGGLVVDRDRRRASAPRSRPPAPRHQRRRRTRSR